MTQYLNVIIKPTSNIVFQFSKMFTKTTKARGMRQGKGKAARMQPKSTITKQTWIQQNLACQSTLVVEKFLRELPESFLCSTEELALEPRTSAFSTIENPLRKGQRTHDPFTKRIGDKVKKLLAKDPTHKSPNCPRESKIPATRDKTANAALNLTQYQESIANYSSIVIESKESEEMDTDENNEMSEKSQNNHDKDDDDNKGDAAGNKQ
ncbi:hypothetical protein DFH27DRAFT_529628 [Peziza echinospora]|nr:hypothetical protein DFH27DRAFT_529628 [Peziza echinospora]